MEAAAGALLDAAAGAAQQAQPRQSPDAAPTPEQAMAYASVSHAPTTARPVSGAAGWAVAASTLDADEAAGVGSSTAPRSRVGGDCSPVRLPSFAQLLEDSRGQTVYEGASQGIGVGALPAVFSLPAARVHDQPVSPQGGEQTGTPTVQSFAAGGDAERRRLQQEVQQLQEQLLAMMGPSQALPEGSGSGTGPWGLPSGDAQADRGLGLPAASASAAAPDVSVASGGTRQAPAAQQGGRGYGAWPWEASQQPPPVASHRLQPSPAQAVVAGNISPQGWLQQGSSPGGAVYDPQRVPGYATSEALSPAQRVQGAAALPPVQPHTSPLDRGPPPAFSSILPHSLDLDSLLDAVPSSLHVRHGQLAMPVGTQATSTLASALKPERGASGASHSAASDQRSAGLTVGPPASSTSNQPLAGMLDGVSMSSNPMRAAAWPAFASLSGAAAAFKPFPEALGRAAALQSPAGREGPVGMGVEGTPRAELRGVEVDGAPRAELREAEVDDAPRAEVREVEVDDATLMQLDAGFAMLVHRHDAALQDIASLADIAVRAQQAADEVAGELRRQQGQLVGSGSSGGVAGAEVSTEAASEVGAEAIGAGGTGGGFPGGSQGGEGAAAAAMAMVEVRAVEVELARAQAQRLVVMLPLLERALQCRRHWNACRQRQAANGLAAAEAAEAARGAREAAQLHEAQAQECELRAGEGESMALQLSARAQLVESSELLVKAGALRKQAGAARAAAADARLRQAQYSEAATHAEAAEAAAEAEAARWEVLGAAWGQGVDAVQGDVAAAALQGGLLLRAAELRASFGAGGPATAPLAAHGSVEHGGGDGGGDGNGGLELRASDDMAGHATPSQAAHDSVDHGGVGHGGLEHGGLEHGGFGHGGFEHGSAEHDLTSSSFAGSVASGLLEQASQRINQLMLQANSQLTPFQGRSSQALQDAAARDVTSTGASGLSLASAGGGANESALSPATLQELQLVRQLCDLIEREWEAARGAQGMVPCLAGGRRQAVAAGAAAESQAGATHVSRGGAAPSEEVPWGLDQGQGSPGDPLRFSSGGGQGEGDLPGGERVWGSTAACRQGQRAAWALYELRCCRQELVEALAGEAHARASAALRSMPSPPPSPLRGGHRHLGSPLGSQLGSLRSGYSYSVAGSPLGGALATLHTTRSVSAAPCLPWEGQGGGEALWATGQPAAGQALGQSFSAPLPRPMSTTAAAPGSDPNLTNDAAGRHAEEDAALVADAARFAARVQALQGLYEVLAAGSDASLACLLHQTASDGVRDAIQAQVRGLGRSHLLCSCRAAGVHAGAALALVDGRLPDPPAGMCKHQQL